MDIEINKQLRITHANESELDQIIIDNTYDNPKYRQALSMGYSTNGIDEEITTYTLADEYIEVPRGYLHELTGNITDTTTQATANIPSLNGVTLRDYQSKAVNDAMKFTQGIIQSGTGSGKTIMGLELMSRLQQRTLILTHSKELMYQWEGEIKKLMGIECGVIGGGKDTQGNITIAMLQTLSKRPERLKQISNEYGLVLVEECHHIPSNTFAKVINQLACKYRYGLTATPHRKDGLHELIFRQIGDVIAKVSDSDIEQVGGTVPITVKAINTGRSYYADSWGDYITQLTEDMERNKLVISLAEKASLTTSTIILTDRVEHAKALSELTTEPHLLIHGKLSAKDRKERMGKIKESQLTIGTTGLLGEGLDVSAWQSLILSTPISSRVKLLQAIGRVMRPHEGKTTGYVADLVDETAMSASSHMKRKEIYNEKNFRQA